MSWYKELSDDANRLPSFWQEIKNTFKEFFQRSWFCSCHKCGSNYGLHPVNYPELKAIKWECSDCCSLEGRSQ